MATWPGADQVSSRNGQAPELTAPAAPAAVLATVLARHADLSELVVRVLAERGTVVRAVRVDLPDEPSFAELSARAESARAEVGPADGEPEPMPDASDLVTYEAQPYEGEMLVFYGDGLYEDPELGWTGLATGGIHSYGIPGGHWNNRQAMSEPGVGFVSERLQAYLARAEPERHDERSANAPAAR